MKYPVVIMFLLSSCSLFHRGDRHQEVNPGLNVAAYYFTVYADTLRSERIILDSISAREKKIDTSTNVKLSDYMEFHFLNKAGRTNSILTIQHPLFVEVSFINEQGKPGTLPVMLPFQSFALRKLLDKRDVELHVYERVTGREKIRIGEFDLTRNQKP